MPLALLLSPDDQAVSAITGVLEEMSVSCERPLDGASAAQKLHAQSFDLVLADCENLPAAKLIFDVCRRAKAGTNPVPIAIVDGRAGLPTAFRLGAELILTKPVSKDQARTTIRTAVSRLKKEEPPRVTPPVEPLVTEPKAAAAPEPRVQAAAAAAASQPAPAMSITAPPAPPTSVSAPPPGSFLPPLAEASAAPKEAVAPPETPKPAPKPASLSSIPKTLSEPASPKPTPRKVSDDPVLAELESAETRPPAPVFSAYAQPKRKSHGLRIFLLLVLLIVGGFYAGWTYQPDFRRMVEPYVEKVLTIVNMATPRQPARPPQSTASPVPAKPTVTPTTPPSTGVPAAPSTAAASVPVTAAPASTGLGSAGSPAGISSAVTAPAQPVPASVQPTPATATATAAATAGLASKPAPTQATGASEKETADTGTSPDNELPGEKNAIILSSKGAEKRLVHQVQPVFPSGPRSAANGTVVLKALVNEAGRVEGVRVVEGNSNLAAAASKAVKQWRYRPYVRNGRAYPFVTVVLVDFQRP